MNENKETSLVIKNDSFFDRLKIFLKMFFNFFNNTEETQINTNEKTNNKNIVNKNLEHIENMTNVNLTEKDYEKNLQDILIQLQAAYEDGTIKEEELTSDQKEDLKKLYIIQINSLKESIEKNEAVILKLKEKIEIINENK